MFEKGEYVVYGTKGVCQVEDITHVDMPGADKDRLYYVLCPVHNTSGKIFSPVDNQKIVMRRVITAEEAKELIAEIPSIEEIWITDERAREAKYKEAMQSCNYKDWVGIIKTLYMRKQRRIAQGKKVTALDEKYLHLVESELYDELSIALNVPANQMEQHIREQIGS
ncbi:MAG: CarD family transcriptional regulator [Roseburia sp.]